MALFEAARTHAIADGRKRARIDDVQKVATMALRMRRSKFIEEYLSLQEDEAKEIQTISKRLRSKGKSAKK
jgi:Mg-chelatase subunit ChlI